MGDVYCTSNTDGSIGVPSFLHFLLKSLKPLNISKKWPKYGQFFIFLTAAYHFSKETTSFLRELMCDMYLLLGIMKLAIFAKISQKKSQNQPNLHFLPRKYFFTIKVVYFPSNTVKTIGLSLLIHFL